MSHSLKVRSIGILLLAAVLIGVIWAGPFGSLWTHKGNTAHAAPSSLPFNQYANGPYKVQGNTILGADGKPYLFHGVGRDGLEFVCSGPGYLDTPHLALMGPPIPNGITGGTYWYGNTVRLPLSEGFWLRGFGAQSCTAAQYQGIVKSTVDALTVLKLNVMLDLQWTDAGGQAGGGGASFQMADNDSVFFWTQVAKIYSGYSNVLFELLNEPHPLTPSVTNPWQCWQQGCAVTNDGSIQGTCNCTPSYPGVGMQTLVNTVRGAAPNNLVLVAGTNWGFDLSQLSSFPITGSNIVYDAHPYAYNGKMPPDWDAAFGYLTATAPVMSAENGEYDCGTSYMSQLLAYFDAHNMGWIGWAWFDVGSACGYPQLITDYNGTPAASMGTLEYQRLLSYANGTPSPSPTPNLSPTPTPPPVTGPVNKQWNFAEGRAGAGFQEWLTLGNPTPNACTVTLQYLYTPDRGTAQTKTVSVPLSAFQRATENVDADLGTSPTGPGITDSAVVTVNNTATPNCAGIVAERPMYFNAFGNQLGATSGHDVIGTTSTHLGTTFYFADVPVGRQAGGGSSSSFLAILNPPNAPTATVTATYYANGQQVGTQQATVPGGTRGTITPQNASPSLPSHVAVVVTSTQPVLVERPTYFSNINGGNAGTVSGAADVVGVQSLANDWLFAEGYTGGQFQENFVLANLDPSKAAATVTINLEYTDGTTHQFTVTVNALSQVVWNVNTNGTNPTSQSVSAEITATGANIVVEREMYFKYNHVANGRTLTASGGTDVIGQLGPANASSYSFAEGYTNVGYDEWLTVQNPTANTETITVSLVNAMGATYTFPITVVAHSRYTVDIVAAVLQHMYQSGDTYKAFEVSMALQSSSGPFVAERPMYWNTSGTTGGTDVVGYIGG